MHIAIGGMPAYREGDQPVRSAASAGAGGGGRRERSPCGEPPAAEALVPTRPTSGARLVTAASPAERWALGVELMAHRPDVLHSPDFIPPAFGAPP